MVDDDEPKDGEHEETLLTENNAAAHESGHLIACELLKYQASAYIRRSEAGWTGDCDMRVPSSAPKEHLRLIAVAGPMAEAVLTRGRGRSKAMLSRADWALAGWPTPPEDMGVLADAAHAVLDVLAQAPVRARLIQAAEDIKAHQTVGTAGWTWKPGDGAGGSFFLSGVSSRPNLFRWVSVGTMIGGQTFETIREHETGRVLSQRPMRSANEPPPDLPLGISVPRLSLEQIGAAVAQLAAVKIERDEMRRRLEQTERKVGMLTEKLLTPQRVRILKDRAGRPVGVEAA